MIAYSFYQLLAPYKRNLNDRITLRRYKVSSKALLFSFLTLLWAVANIQAQTCSCAGAPLTNSLGIGMVAESPWELQLKYDVHRIQHLVTETSVLEVGVNQRQTQTGLLQLTRTIGERWQFTGVVSWVEQRFQAQNTIKAQGLGDLIVLGQYRLLGGGASLQALYVGAGVKLPTGKTNLTNDSGLLLNPDLQPGTGAWDGIFSLLYTKSGLWSPKSNLQVSATYRITSTAERFSNTQSYRFGPELLLQAGASHKLALGKQQLVPLVLLRYRRTAHDLLNENQAFNTGGQWLNAGGGLQWQWTEGISLQSNMLFPLYRKLQGTQLTSSWRLTFALNISLPWNKKPADTPALPSTYRQ